MFELALVCVVLYVLYKASELTLKALAVISYCLAFVVYFSFLVVAAIIKFSVRMAAIVIKFILRKYRGALKWNPVMTIGLTGVVWLSLVALSR